MPVLTIDSFEKQEQQLSNHPQTVSSSHPTDITDYAPATTTFTPTEFIFNTMGSASKSASPPETAELVSLSKRKRCNNGSPTASMDIFLRSEDFEMDGGRLQSADFVKDLLKAELTSVANDENPSNEKERIVVDLPAKPERISSGNWIQDFEGHSVDIGPMDPSLFMDDTDVDGAAGQLVASRNKLERISSGDWMQDFKPLFMDGTDVDGALPPLTWYDEYQMPLADPTPIPPMPPLPPLPSPMDKHENPSTSTTTHVAKTNAESGKKKKRRKPRAIDESRAVEKTDGDVLFGRGGSTNKHPGNIRFRRKALEYRQWYGQSTKEEKQRIADLLVDFVKSEGRFLEKGKDGLWHEVIGNGAHTKASQALRERIRKRRKTEK